MSGRDAAHGFEYQYLITLEYALVMMLPSDSEFTDVHIEGVRTSKLETDKEIIDFSLVSGSRDHTVAQVKSGRPGSTLSAADVLVMLGRMYSHEEAHRYLVVTNRAAGGNLVELLELMTGGTAHIRTQVLSLVSRANVANNLAVAGREFWECLRRTEIRLDHRDIEQVRADVQELVRTARHRVAPASVGWDATGLLTGYLVCGVMTRAAGPQKTALSRAELSEALCFDADKVKSLMHQRDWAVHVTPPPRTTEVARRDLLAELAHHLPIPIPRDAAPVCLISGLSGIGKSSLVAAWADENAYAYWAIIWIDATNEPRMRESYNIVARWFEDNGLIAGDQAVPVERRVSAALARSARPWLMVFDNCSDQAVIRPWIPQRGHGHVVVTSTDRTPLSGSHTSQLEVGGMAPAEATRLLSLRLLHHRLPNGREQRALDQLAARLHRWPLALEIAAAYLLTTQLDHDDIPGAVAGFEHLLERAMADLPSAPMGYRDYPLTVVGAITMTWARLTARTGVADILAANALRTATFLASRQIPVNLLLGCAGENVDQQFPHYALADPPAGEVLRAIQRDCLVTVDEQIPISRSGARGPVRLLNVTVAMNDIVQLVVRQLVEHEDQTEPALFRAVYSTQAWMTFFGAGGDIELTASLLHHAVAVSALAYEMDPVSQANAQLWGNIARTLACLGKWGEAVHYLCMEQACLENLTDREVGDLLIQSVAYTTRAFYNLADHSHHDTSLIIESLERLIAMIPTTADRHPEATGAAIAVGSATVRNLLEDGANHPKLKAIAAALHDFQRIVPPTKYGQLLY
ncbi:P-loop NTPase family protein [Nocardia suismassiliense]|uniref:ATP-binding protein n=1 Tax=Nocardia suismassiliense TaxID=2077092 RepID=UPI000D1EEBF7|nr:ATP-binding protein [Nocardia suismassiliense]